MRLEKAQETVIANLRQNGYFKTKSEAIRAGIMELGRHYNIVAVHDDMVIRQVTDPAEAAAIRNALEKARKSGKKFETLEEVNKRYGFVPEKK